MTGLGWHKFIHCSSSGRLQNLWLKRCKISWNPCFGWKKISALEAGQKKALLITIMKKEEKREGTRWGERWLKRGEETTHMKEQNNSHII